VELKPGTDPAAFTKKQGITSTHLYKKVMNGFSAKLSAKQFEKVTSDPAVVAVTNDRVVGTIEPPAGRESPRKFPWDRTRPGVAPYEDVPQPEQYISNEIQRVRATESLTADIDGQDDQRIDVDIAILDTGIDPYHPDLNVVGGYDCIDGGSKGDRGWYDRGHHGTFVAGQAAAIDNSIGVVGVAPGARLHAIRVLKPGGRAPESAYLCGLEWVIRNADLIEVANMSLGARDVVGTCGAVRKESQPRRADKAHDAICRAAAAGVTMTASAGNEGDDVSRYTPAAYEEIIGVSAIGDFDGKPGGHTPSEPPCFPGDPDDAFAFFSNYGKEIDIAAPGICNVSTHPGGLYAVADGTSFAAPLVAGGAALLLAKNPNMTPVQVRAKILATAEPGPIPGDPDSYPEGILDVSTF
jgi:subtilisin family serine protease